MEWIATTGTNRIFKGSGMIWHSTEIRLSEASSAFDTILASHASSDFSSLESALDSQLALLLERYNDDIFSLYAKRNAVSRRFAEAIRRREGPSTILGAWFELIELFYNDPNQLAQHFVLLSNFAMDRQNDHAIESEINRIGVLLKDEVAQGLEFSTELLQWFDNQRQL